MKIDINKSSSAQVEELKLSVGNMSISTTEQQMVSIVYLLYVIFQCNAQYENTEHFIFISPAL